MKLICASDSRSDNVAHFDKDQFPASSIIAHTITIIINIPVTYNITFSTTNSWISLLLSTWCDERQNAELFHHVLIVINEFWWLSSMSVHWWSSMSVCWLSKMSLDCHQKVLIFINECWSLSTSIDDWHYDDDSLWLLVTVDDYWEVWGLIWAKSGNHLREGLIRKKK